MPAVDDVTAQPGRGQVDHPHSRPESDQAGVSDEQLTSESALVLVEASPDGLLLVDEAGIILLANQKIEEMFGYDRAELIGRPVEVLVPDRARQVHTAHRIRYRAAPQGRPMGVGLELYGRRRDGTELPVEISLSPVDTGSSLRVIACVRDVTDRHRAEARVRMLSETMDALHDAVFMFDPDSLQFSYVNDGAVLQTGYSREELLTMTPLHIAPDFTQTDFSAMLTGLLAGQVNRHGFTTVHRRKDGTDVPVEVFLEYPEPANPTQPRFLVAVVRDISERREAELERQRHERWLDALATVREAYLEDRPRAAVLPLICERGRDLVGAEGGILLLRDGDDRLTIAAVVGDVARGSTGESIPIDASLGGEVVRTGATVSVEDVSADPRATGPIAAHRGPAVFAPLAADQMVLGVLVIVASFDRGPFTPVEVATIESFAAQAAIAMVLGQARADRARLSILEDRERIAADLHDRVIQRLFATGMSLQATAGRIGDHAVAPRIDAAVRELDETITELRSAIFRLSERPEDAPFTDRIRAVVARAAPPGLDPAVRLVGDVDGLRPAVFEQLVPTIEEALSNVTRHAGASEVTVELVVDAVDARLSVCDDGVGIAPDAVPGTGLKSLRARAERLGGTCHIDTEPGAGTTITWRVPL